MSTIIATVKDVRVVVNEDKSTVEINLKDLFVKNDDGSKGGAATIKSYKLDKETGAYVEVDVTSMTNYRSVITAQLCELNDDIALLRCVSDSVFGQKEFGHLLFGATLTIVNKFVKAGETVYGERAATRDCYVNSIVGVKLTDKAKKWLEKKLDE